jgi:hypothetical protein
MKIKGKDGRQDVGGSAHCTGIRKGKSWEIGKRNHIYSFLSLKLGLSTFASFHSFPSYISFPVYARSRKMKHEEAMQHRKGKERKRLLKWVSANPLLALFSLLSCPSCLLFLQLSYSQLHSVIFLHFTHPSHLPSNFLGSLFYTP